MQTSVSQTNERPRCFDFTDYRAYLKAYYDWQKGMGDFSHRLFCENAGLKSRSYLRLVLSGKRNLTPNSISKFAAALNLNAIESEGFTALVHFNQAADLDSRKYYWEMFSKIRPKSVRSQTVHDAYAYLTRMSYPILLGILRQEHVAQDRESLSEMTGMTVTQVDEAIGVLEQLGAVIRMPEGKLKVTSASFQTADDVSNVAVPTFHRNMLKLAQEKACLPSSEREFQSVIVALDDTDFLFVKNKLRDLAKELDERLSQKNPRSNKVCAINLNLIPVTPSFIRADKQTVASQKAVEAQISNKEFSL